MSNELEKDLKELASKYPNLDLKNAQYNEDGSLTMNLGVLGQAPQTLPDGVDVVSEKEAGNLTGSVTQQFSSKDRKLQAALNQIRVPPLDRSYLDLSRSSFGGDTPHDLYKKAVNYWRCKPVYRSVVNNLANFSSKGFENDIDDPTIKNFYDNWVVDTGFDALIDKIFLVFFREGMVRTYKVLGPYEPKVNHLSTIPGQKPKRASKKITAQRKRRFSKNYIPIAYTILNPAHVKIEGSLMFGQTSLYLQAKAGEEIRQILKLSPNKRSKFQKNILRRLPKAFKDAVEKGVDIPLDPELIGEVDYRRMPFERYPIPRGAAAFEAIEFKDDLRIADSSTLDGITNYILKITVGNDKYPVNKQEVLDRVGEMFNTVSKSFKVVWGHTLDVEKITSENVGEILGKDKYIQTNEDITAGLGFPRALIDGLTEGSPAALELAVKSVIEEVNYARSQVKRWIYNEYRELANAVGFDRYPSVRFDDMALRDELAMMSIIQGMIDRRIISYRTGQKKLGFDPDTELSQLQEEKELVVNGDLGIMGSPYQQSVRGAQPTQRTPNGTPSEGRPRGRPTKTPESKDKTAPPKNKKDQVVDNTSAAVAFTQLANELTIEEIESLLKGIKNAKEENNQ